MPKNASHSSPPPLAATSLLARTSARRLYGAVARRLGMDILAGVFPPGSVFPGELEFSESLGVSRTAYREGLQVLSAKGLVESRPKSGTRVLPRQRWHLLDPEVLGWAFQGEPDIQLVKGLFELRIIIEPAAAALAAERRSKADVQTMRSALKAMSHHGLASEAGRAADKEFHQAILNATQNDALAALSAGICAAVSWTTVFKQRQQALPRNPIPDHRQVFDAIAQQDSQAAAVAMRQLVSLALEDTTLSMAMPTD